MSRIRPHYSKDEIITDLYTYGTEWMYEDTLPYIGVYHRYTTGEVYTGASYNENTSKKLIPYVDTTTAKYRYKQLKTIATSYDTVNKHILEITSEDYDNGYVMRYFINKVNENSIFEISKKKYDDHSGTLIDPNLYRTAVVKWQLTGQQTNTVIGGITTMGVAEKNMIATRRAEIGANGMVGLSTYLSNYLEYYTDTDVTVPANINGANKRTVGMAPVNPAVNPNWDETTNSNGPVFIDKNSAMGY